MKGEFEKQLTKIYVTCDLCKMQFDDLDKFDEHWQKEHMATYGAHSYKKITAGIIYTKDALKVVDEARKEMPLEMFDYKQPRKWNLLEYQQYYDALAHQVLELLLWFEKWFGSDENEEVKKENE